MISRLIQWLFVSQYENRDYTTTGGNTPLPELLRRIGGEMKQEVR